jgi:hypothetical protein
MEAMKSSLLTVRSRFSLTWGLKRNQLRTATRLAPVGIENVIGKYKLQADVPRPCGRNGRRR